jgi:uncharacterized protein
MRVILDSNVLFSALISPHSPPHRVFQAWRQGVFDLVTCKEQIEEIRRASRYQKFKAILQPHEVGLMLNNMKNALVIEICRPAMRRTILMMRFYCLWP